PARFGGQIDALSPDRRLHGARVDHSHARGHFPVGGGHGQFPGVLEQVLEVLDGVDPVAHTRGQVGAHSGREHVSTRFLGDEPEPDAELGGLGGDGEELGGEGFAGFLVGVAGGGGELVGGHEAGGAGPVGVGGPGGGAV